MADSADSVLKQVADVAVEEISQAFERYAARVYLLYPRPQRPAVAAAFFVAARVMADCIEQALSLQGIGPTVTDERDERFERRFHELVGLYRTGEMLNTPSQEDSQ